jgi:hypothetical protein
VDDNSYLEKAKVFLSRSECRTYTGNAVENTRDVYEKLGAKGVGYFDVCNPDGSRKPNNTNTMCLEHVYGPLKAASKFNILNLAFFDQKPFITDEHVGFGRFGIMYVPTACSNKTAACGLQINFHGCGSAGPDSPEYMGYAEANNIVLIHPNVPGRDIFSETPFNNGNNAAEYCNKGTDMFGNCKEISRGCWDGYG